MAAVAAVAGVAAAALVGAWWFLLRDVAQPVSVDDAIAAYRVEKENAVRPLPTGVYLFATDGSEETDALGGVTHRYPRTTTVTASAAPCGVRLRWDALRGRSTTWTVCTGTADWIARSRFERHTFFGVTDETTYACGRTQFRPAGDRPATSFTIDCSTGKATERGRGAVVGRETVRVGETSVPTVHVRTVTTFSGDTTGAATYEFWLARTTGLPVRIDMVSRTTSGSLIGDVHYRERVSLRLTSLAPRR